MVKFDKSLYQEIGKQIKDARIKKGMSLQDMSDAINGIKTKQTIMRYENGDTRIEAEVMMAICNVLGLDVDEVVHNAELTRALGTYYHTSFEIGKSATAKLAKELSGKMSKDTHYSDLLTAYDNADERTQKAVRVLLGIDK